MVASNPQTEKPARVMTDTLATTTKPVMTSERLVLRSADPSDMEGLYEMVFSDAEVMKTAFYNKPMNREQATAFFHSKFDFVGSGKQLGVLCLKVTGEIIGFSGLMPCNVLGQDDYEIGFVLGRVHWGKGYATEIGKAQVQFGLHDASGPRCSRLLGLVRPDNAASKKALVKSGLSFHSTVQTDRGVSHVYCITK